MGREKHKVDNFIAFRFKQIFENLIEVDGLYHAVAFGDSEYHFFESDLFVTIDNPGLEAHLSCLLHVDLANFINSLLVITEKTPAIVFLGAPNNGKILSIEVHLLLEIFKPLYEIIIIGGDVVNLFLELIHHGDGILLG